MENIKQDFYTKRPQELCKMCGKCCKVVTTYIPYEDLIQLKNNGDQGAIDFLELFEPYKNIEEAKKILPDVVDNIINSLKEDNNYNESKMTFYKCKYLGENNLCTNYENRKTLCKHFPSSPWAIVPPGCGFEGWLFLKREETKQRIRKVKEDMLELELLKQKVNKPEIISKISSVEEKMKVSIELEHKHGSDNW